MFAKIVQKWNAFKADWNEYQRLRRVAARAWHKLDAIRYKITASCDLNGKALKKACIEKKWMDLPTSVQADDMGFKQVVPFPYDSYCMHFNRDDETVSCKQTNCPCYAGNCEYVAAAKELEIARTNRRNFWNQPKTK